MLVLVVVVCDLFFFLLLFLFLIVIMGRTCSVKKCRSNGRLKGHITTFKFPDTPQRREKWKKIIKRPDLNVTKYSGVCVEHFDPQVLIKSRKCKDTSGKKVDISRKRLKLAVGACPSPLQSNSSCQQPAVEAPTVQEEVYQGIEEEVCPTTPTSSKSSNHQFMRQNPEVQQEKEHERELEEARLAAVEADKIESFDAFKNALPYKNLLPFTAIFKESYVVFVRVEDIDFGSIPSTKIAFKVNDNLDVKVFIDSQIDSISKYGVLLGKELKCDKWCKFGRLIKSLSSLNCSPVSLSDQIKFFVERTTETVDYIVENGLDQDSDDIVVKLKFLLEQLSLLTKSIPRYSPKMLKWTAAFFYTHPGAYKFIRATNSLTLPHPRYLQKILGKLGSNGPGLTPDNVAFLHEKFKLLEDNDKIVSLLLDEIYVNATVKYKGGKISGLAAESRNTSDCTAGTLQSFMYSSMRSSNTDVVSLVPVRNIDGDVLEKLTLEVLKVLHEVGYTVLTIIADNNSVNRKMYENLCGGELKEWIPHPFDSSKRLYLMFDNVHILKNLRNNWIGIVNQILKIPEVKDYIQWIKEYKEDSKSDKKSVIVADVGNSVPLEESNENLTCNVEFDDASLADLEKHWLQENKEDHDPYFLDDDILADFENDSFLDTELSEVIDSNVENIPHSEAKFSDIKALFYAESRSILKLGNKLTRKSVFPSKIDRQNVDLVLNVFNDNTILALELLKKDGSMNVSEGTIVLLCWLVRWWKVINVKSPFTGKRLNDKWCLPIYGKDDHKLNFLREFLKFLEEWKNLGLKEGLKGKLTPQTHEALTHTLSAQISLCIYIFEEYGWVYIMIGVWQTDRIEARFGGYRRISGCNFHVSAEQCYENERKLRVLGVLKLKAASVGEFSISAFTQRCKAAYDDEVDENLTDFTDCVFDKANVPVSLNNRRILIILSSYCATKVIQQYNRENRPMCVDCETNLITDTPLEIERAAEVYEYLSGIDRGGLNKPAAFSFDLCVNIFKLFETLISPTYEDKFLKLRFHKRAIVTLGLKMCSVALENPQFVCNECETCVEKVIKKFLDTMANILLNNYTKKMNDVNTARQIAAKLSRQNALKEKNVLKEISNNTNNNSNFGKKKDMQARKIMKLGSNTVY